MELPRIDGSIAAQRQAGATGSTQDRALMDVARDLEATFLSEMLKHAGVGKPPESFGGGIGEEQFSGFLRDMQAAEIAARGGIGLAENIYESLKETPHDL